MDPRQKKTISLQLGIIAVLVAAILIVLGLKAQEAREAQEAEAQEKTAGAITQRHAYTALSYHNGATALSFAVNEEGAWAWAEDPDFPLDDTTVTAIVDLLAALKPQQTLANEEGLEAYGLDQPAMTLTAAAENGGTLTLAFGKTTTDGSSYYMQLNGEEETVYIVAGTLAALLQTPIYDMCRLPELPTLNREAIDTVAVSAGETELQFSAVRPKGEEDGASAPASWTSGGEDVTGSAAVAALLQALEGLAFEKCVDYRPSDEAASICGFDAPAAVLSAFYRRESGELEELTLSIGTRAHGAEGYYVRWNDDPTIYLLSAALAEPVLAAAADGL